MKYITRAPMLRANTSTTWEKEEHDNVTLGVIDAFNLSIFCK